MVSSRESLVRQADEFERVRRLMYTDCRRSEDAAHSLCHRPTSQAATKRVLKGREGRDEIMLLVDRADAPSSTTQFGAGHPAEIASIHANRPSGGSQGSVEQPE